MEYGLSSFSFDIFHIARFLKILQRLNGTEIDFLLQACDDQFGIIRSTSIVIESSAVSAPPFKLNRVVANLFRS